jgi:hypothetical protein
VIINMLVKSAALLCIWIIYNDLGGVISFPSRTRAAPLSPLPSLRQLAHEGSGWLFAAPSGSAGYHHFGPAHIDEDDFSTSRHGRHDHDREGAYQARPRRA